MARRGNEYYGKAGKRWNLDLLEGARIALHVPLSQLTGQQETSFFLEKLSQLEQSEREIVETFVDSLLSKNSSGKPGS
jgi:hypothetical protein